MKGPARRSRAGRGVQGAAVVLSCRHHLGDGGACGGVVDEVLAGGASPMIKTGGPTALGFL